MYHVIKNQKDLDAWMQQMPDKASVIQKYKGIKNALKEAVVTLVKHEMAQFVADLVASI